jgi:plasmid maintenance system antidote protein VapI
MNQVALPVEVRPEEVSRKHSLGAAIELCAELAGFSLDKELQHAMGVDKAQFSRWMSGTEGIVWPKFTKLMDACGNDAPLMWMLHQRGYDLHSVRKLESETEKQNRLLREENAALRRVLAVGVAA